MTFWTSRHVFVFIVSGCSVPLETEVRGGRAIGDCTRPLSSQLENTNDHREQERA